MLEPDGVPRNVILADAKLNADVPELPPCFSSSENQPSYGFWYNVVGTGNPMSVMLETTRFDLAGAGAGISVLLGFECSNFSCVLTDCILDTKCVWESTADDLYYIFMTSIDFSEEALTELLGLFTLPNLMVTADG